MRQCQISHVNPQIRSRVGDLILVLSLDEIPDPLIGGIQRVEGVEVVDHGTEDHGWTHGREREIGLLFRDEIPCGALSEGLGGAVAEERVLDCLAFGDGVPVLFGVGLHYPFISSVRILRLFGV